MSKTKNSMLDLFLIYFALFVTWFTWFMLFALLDKFITLFMLFDLLFCFGFMCEKKKGEIIFNPTKDRWQLLNLFITFPFAFPLIIGFNFKKELIK